MTAALVLSGGIGRRLISEVPKQYVTVQGKMIVIHTIQKLCASEMIDSVQVVAEKGWWEPMMTELTGVSKLKGFSLPGENRQLSILNGLRDMKQYLSDDDTVFIQDAVRPMVSDDLISGIIKAAAGHDGAVPVLPLKDTVYKSDDGISLTGTLERGKILAGQAPEAFSFGKYLKANESLSNEVLLSLSGSAEPALMAGLDIVTLPGDEKNFKITTNEDLDRFIRIVEENRLFTE